MGQVELVKEKFAAVFTELDVQSVGNLQKRDMRHMIEMLTHKEEKHAPNPPAQRQVLRDQRNEQVV